MFFRGDAVGRRRLATSTLVGANAKGVSLPVAVTVFPGEQYEAPRSWTERAYPKLIYYNRAEKGGHFAAWEQPTIFVQELRAAFRSVR